MEEREGFSVLGGPLRLGSDLRIQFRLARRAKSFASPDKEA